MKTKEIIMKIINYCKDNNKDTRYVLSNYFETLEPIYLPQELRYLNNYIDRDDLYEFITEEIIRNLT